MQLIRFSAKIELINYPTLRKILTCKISPTKLEFNWIRVQPTPNLVTMTPVNCQVYC